MTEDHPGEQQVPRTLATGIGSVPGDRAAEAVRWVADALPELPHLPELPARGPWAAITGRAAALLVDLPLELELDRWRIAQAPGRDVRTSRALLEEDLDALEEVLSEFVGPVKVQVCGPLTLAATVELRGGDVLASDPSALRDVADSLGEGVQAHLADLARRLPGAQLVLQVDEPASTAVTAGDIPRPSGWGTHRPVPSEEASAALSRVLTSARRVRRGAGVPTVVHCCAGDLDWSVLGSCGAGALSLDVESLDLAAHASQLGEWVDDGKAVWAGVELGERAPDDRSTAGGRLRQMQGVLGLSPESFAAAVGVTPRCGQPRGSVPVVAAAYAAARDLARGLRDAADGSRR